MDNISTHVTGSQAGLVGCHGLIQNNIIWGNGAASAPQLVFSSAPQNCIVQNWTGAGEGNITSPPLFVDPDNDDYHLRSGSPAIDRGTTASLTADFEGDARPFDVPGVGFDGAGTGFDIGADEFLPAFFFIREHILGKQLTDDETSDTLNTNQDALIDTSDILNSI